MEQRRDVKIYTIRISAIKFEHNRWYYRKKGDTFRALLVCKECSDGAFTPVFCIVEVEDDRIILPTLVRTVRPEDCDILNEENIMANHTPIRFIRKFGELAA